MKEKRADWSETERNGRRSQQQSGASWRETFQTYPDDEHNGEGDESHTAHSPSHNQWHTH